MPGTTRYSATFDRTYEEEDRVGPSPPSNARRSRSQSWQANSGLDNGRPYTPLGGRPPNQRSSSTDNGPQNIPTRTVGKTAVKAHNNPFQFVKVGTCPLYKKAEEQLKKTKEVKQPEVLKEEEEEWQSNLDSWKSRRRKMSEDVFRRAEEVRQFELEEQESQLAQKKTKTFSEMVEQRATRGRTLSLCLISSPLELTNWEFDGSHKNGSYSTFSGESEENSTVNSEDEGVSLKGVSEESVLSKRSISDSHIDKNGSENHNGGYNKLSDFRENNLQGKPKEGSYIDSGLESISSHRAGDTPDSGSDFSHDSGSSIDCDSPRTGVNLLEEFSTKSQNSPGQAATNGISNGFSISENKPENSVKANSSEVSSSKTKSLQYEKSIESENEMFVDDYEELQRQSDLLASHKKSETYAQANGHIRPASVNGVTPNITLSKTSTSKQKSNVPNGSVEGPIKSEQNSELGSENQINGDMKVKNKTRRKGVYSLDVSAAPSQISKGGKSVNSLFPLFPVTELPSPEDNKTMASTLSSNLTTVSDSGKANNSKALGNQAAVEPSPSVKEKPKPATIVTEAVNFKNVSSDDLKVISPKIEMKSDAIVTPSSPSIESKAKNAIPVSPQKEKPKIILKKIKIKPKKETPTENEITKEVSTSPSLPSPIVKNVEKDKSIKDFKSVPQNEEKLENIKNKSKSESSKITESIPANTIAETNGSNSISSNGLKNNSKDGKKTDSIDVSATEITVNKETSTLVKSPQVEISKPSLGPKKMKIKIKKETATGNQITKEVFANSSLPSPIDISVKSIEKDKLIKESMPQNKGKLENVNSESKQQESSKILESIPANTIAETNGSNSISSNDLKNNSKDGRKIDSIDVSATEITVNKEMSTLVKSPQVEILKPSLDPEKMKIKIKETATGNQTTKEVFASSSLPSPIDMSVKSIDKDKLTKESVPQNKGKLENVKSESKQQESSKILESIPANTIAETNGSNSIPSNGLKNNSKGGKKADSIDVSATEITVNKETSTLVKSPQVEVSKPSLGLKKMKIKIKKETATGNQITKEVFASSSLPSPIDMSVKIIDKDKLIKDSVPQNKGKLENVKSESKQQESSKILESVPANTAAETNVSKNISSNNLKNNSKDGKSTDPITVSSTEITVNKGTSTLVESQGEMPKPSLGPKKIKIKKEIPTENQITKEVSTGSPLPSPIDVFVKNVEKDKSIKEPKLLSQNEGRQENNIERKQQESSKIMESIPANTVAETNGSKNIPSNDVESNSKDGNKPGSIAISSTGIIVNKGTSTLVESPQGEMPKPTLGPKKVKIRIKKNANSQKVNTPAKQIEECKNLNDSLNIVFQSEPKNINSENQSNVKNSEINSNVKANIGLVPDVPPVEKVAEEMEKLILEQLEEEERAKELASGLLIKSSVGSPEHLLTAPRKLAEPPKEKPPPPPSANEGNQKDTSLKRVNSTKRIKKEIYKRRSNFLGIDNADESLACNEPSIPPPPALEEILKAEMELDRQSRLKVENESTERLTLEENEIMQKEREIIESLESEERRKQLINCTEDFSDVAPNNTNDVITEEERILLLKNERKRLETERLIAEDQQLHLLEEKQLREREEFIRKQEAGKSVVPCSDNSLSVADNVPNTSQPSISSLSTDMQTSVSLSGAIGDGNNLTSLSASKKSSESNDKEKGPQKPAVPPKPLKKKEAIRKERERLRQEQEALQREREEHRRKLMQEQEELLKQQKSHAPEAPVASRLGPLPPLVPPLLTTTPNARDSASFPSRSHHGAPNGAAGSNSTAELMSPAVVRQKVPPPRKAVQNEAWGQQKDGGKRSTKSVPPAKDENLNKTSTETSSALKPKENNDTVEEQVTNEQIANDETGNGKPKKGTRKVKRIVKKKISSVRKQNQDSLTESRYNQNHWLIQEAEMRRIAELKERQRPTQLPCSQTCLAEDDVCSNPSRVPVVTPTHNQHLNYHTVQDKMWNYASQPSVPVKKYSAPIVKETLHTIYPRETVSQQPPMKPSRVVPMERQEQMLSVSGRKRCSHCNEELGRGAAMIIESLQLYYHINCFQCCVCHAQLGNGSCGTDVRVRNQKLHCHNCYSNDEAGLKFSQV